MEQEKQPTNLSIALTHFLTAGFATPVIVGALGYLLLQFFPNQPTFFRYLFGLALGIVAIWLGTRYSARYLKITYHLGHTDRIITLSVLFLILLGVLRLLFSFQTGDTTIMIYDTLQFVVMTSLFYLFSKKYFA